VIDEIALLDDLLGGVRQRVGEMLFPSRRRKRDDEIAAGVAGVRAGTRKSVLRVSKRVGC
jgi:hypothetical protein